MATKVKLISETITPTLAGGTLTGDLNFGDSDKAIFGAGTDFEIYSDGGSNNYLISNNGALILRNLGDDKDIYLQSDDGSGGFTSYIHAKGSTGEVILKHYGSNKITTSSTGATVTGNLAVTGDLDITGNVNSASVTDLDVTDKTITLGAGQTEALSGGSGIIIDGSNASILWDETNDEWDFNKSINVTGNVSILADFNGSGNGIGSQLAFTNDHNTDKFYVGIEGNTTGDGFLYQTKNADINFYTNNTFRAKLDNLGNFGIGTSPNTTLTLSDGTDEFDFGVTTNQLLIKSVTSDGSDDQRIIIDAGNGGLSSTRGAYLSLSGNEASSEAGKAIYQMGNVTGSAHVFRKAGGDDAVSINSSGNVKIGTGSPSFYQGSGLEIERAGITTLRLQNTTSVKSTELSQDSDFKIETLNSSMDIVLYPTGNVGIGHASGPDYKLDVLHSGGALSQVVQRVWNNNTSWQAESLTEYYADTYNASFPRTQIGFYRGDTGDNSSSGFIVKTGTTLANQTTNFKVQADGKVSVGHSSPDSTLHVKGTGQLDLLKIERAASTPGITFVNGSDTAGTFGFQLMDNDEYWAGAYDGSNYNYWFKGNSSVFRAEKPVASSTDSGTRQYSHLCTGSFYQSTGAIVIETNIPAHDASGNANMLSIKIRGFEYAIHGSIDLNVGCYAGENQYYSANYNSNYIAEGWRGNIQFAKNDTTGKMAIILGTTSTVQRCELAVVDFIQGFQNVNESYANGWSMSLKTSLSNYSQQTTMLPRAQSPRPGFHAYLNSSTSFAAGTAARLLTQTTFNEGSHYNTSNGRFTAPTEGVYQFNFAFQGQSSSVNQTYVSAEARVNGSTRYIGGWFNKTTGGNNGTNTYSAATGSALIKLSRNDYVEFVCELSNTDSALGGSPGYTYFSGILVG